MVSSIRRLRHIGIAEGFSFLILLFIAMPLKYLANMPTAVLIVGSLHGLLFILYILAIADTWRKLRWPWKRAAAATASSVLPFGPFILEPSLRREQAALEAQTRAEFPS